MHQLLDHVATDVTGYPIHFVLQRYRTWVVERYENKVLDVRIVSAEHVLHDALRVRPQLLVIVLHGTRRVEDQRQAAVHVFWTRSAGIVVSHYQAAHDQRNQPIHRFNGGKKQTIKS